MRYALILLLLVGSVSGASDDYVQSEARAVQTVEYGTVGRAAATVLGAVGRGIAIVQPGAHHLMAGDRVRVLAGPKGSRVERG